MRVLLIDNYDSFTYNLVQAFRILGAEVAVHRNDEIAIADLQQQDFSHLVISPGPGQPRNAGISVEAIRLCAGDKPVLGVCLGHQAIVEAFGGEVGSARTLMHGKSSPVTHSGTGVFVDLPLPFEAGRYHSLAATKLPDCLQVTAQTADQEIMGVQHNQLAVHGVQFHPESVLTPDGDQLLANFLAMEAGRE